MSPERRSALPLVLAGCLLLSGAAALMDQVVWLRYLSLVFGNTTLAAATLLAVFMAGLGGGALAAGRWAPRLRHPLRIYALIEIAIALVALASPRLIDIVDAAYVPLYRAWGSAPVAFALLRALLAAAFLLPPTLLMGATLPLVLRGIAGGTERPGRASALFYGVNTVGAVAGTALAGFVTVRLLGLYATLLLAAAANLLAALAAVAVARPIVPVAAAPVSTVATRRGLLAVVALMGATSLAYEVVWTRILVFYLGSSVYAFSLMLLLVLAGIGLGSLVAAPWADRTGRALGALVAVEAALAGWVPIQVLLFGDLNRMMVAAATRLGANDFAGVGASQLLALLPVLGPPTLLMGISFPLAVRAVHRERAEVGAEVGLVYGFNTLGAVFGALAGGFLLIPLLGTQNGLLAIALVNAALAAGLAVRSTRPLGGLAAAAGATAAIVAGLALLPPDRAILAAGMFRHDRPEDLVYFHEDAQASVTVRRLRAPTGPYLSLELNGVNVAGTSPDLYAVQKLQGHLPLLLAGPDGPVAHIGFGSGGTAWAVSRHPVPEILIVEISPEVLAASDRFFPEINHGVLADPRVASEINDGRNFLLATPRTFRAVLSDSIHPRYAGNSTLYTEEYFRLLASRLEPGGVASMWLPMYSLTPHNYAMILRAFREVFPRMAVWYDPTALNSFTVVTGRRDGAPWDAATLARAFADPAVAGELADIGLSRPADLMPLLVATGASLEPWVGETPPHVDDRPAVEYESGALLMRDEPWLATFDRLLALRPEEAPAEYVEALPVGEREPARRAYRDRAAVLELHRAALAQGIRAQWRSAREAAAARRR